MGSSCALGARYLNVNHVNRQIKQIALSLLMGWLSAMKVNRKYSTLLTALFMTLAMDSTMTFTMNTIMTGWTPGFLQRFLGGWVIGFAVGLPTSLLVIPFARKLVNKLVSE